MKLALFDLDNTLLQGDSDYGWGEFMAAEGLVDKEVHRVRNLQFYNDYKAGILDMHAYLAFQLEVLTRHPRQKLLDLREKYKQTVLTPMMRPKAIEKMAEHRHMGHEIIIITATNEFVTQPSAELFGVDINNLIATQVEQINGQWTGQSFGTPSFAEGKVERLQQWLAEKLDCAPTAALAQCESWFYSDSYNDRPLLDAVQHPIVVTPDDTLRTYACQQKPQWLILDWSIPPSPILPNQIHRS